MNLKNLTPTQKSLVENIVNEFNKVNQPINVSGLIDVAAIIQLDIDNENEIKRVEISNIAKRQMLKDTINQYCNSINLDLIKLGLKAICTQSLSENSLFIMPLNGSVHDNNNIRIETKAITKNNLQTYHGGEILDFNLEFNKAKFGKFEEVFESQKFKDSLLKLYNKEGKKQL